MKPEDLKVNCLYRYREEFGHCRHGLIVSGEGRNGAIAGCDTYWGSSFGTQTEYGYHADLTKIADKLEFICDMTQMKDTYRDVYEQYEESDRAWIPVGGGRERWLINVTAKPSPRLVREQLQSWIDQNRRDIEWKTREIERWTAELAGVKA